MTADEIKRLLVKEQMRLHDRLRAALQECFPQPDDKGDGYQARRFVEDMIASSVKVTRAHLINEIVDVGERDGYKLHGYTGRSWLVVELRRGE